MQSSGQRRGGHGAGVVFRIGKAVQNANNAPTAARRPLTADDIAPYVRNAMVHDPSTIIKCKDEFWVFYTGRGVPSWHSRDLATWERGPGVFTNAPPWVAKAVPANRGMNYWAPDVTFFNGRYLLYYSASTFGKNVSGIGLATAHTLDPNDPAFGWTDQGLVIASTAEGDFNAIDPAIFHDKNGSLWLTFGSFWSGIRMIQLDPQTGKRIAPESPVYYLAHYDSIEASYLYQHDGYYFLFVNWGMCCRGANSTYTIHVGRSKKVTGPYLDREGNGPVARRRHFVLGFDQALYWSRTRGHHRGQRDQLVELPLRSGGRCRQCRAAPGFTVGGDADALDEGQLAGN